MLLSVGGKSSAHDSNNLDVREKGEKNNFIFLLWELTLFLTVKKIMWASKNQYFQLLTNNLHVNHTESESAHHK